MNSPTDREVALENALKKVRTVLDSEISIIVNVDINGKEVGRQVRLYTEKGKALGFGEKVIAKPSEGDDLFSKDYGTYQVSLKVKELFT